ncbi:MAG: SpoIIE family protein phosphatase [Bacteroidales bacterium]|nr:SpoIIE family protein phosphatase [Bacteroidales bacterium]
MNRKPLLILFLCLGMPLMLSSAPQAVTISDLPAALTLKAVYQDEDSVRAITLLNIASQFAVEGNIDSARGYFMEARRVCLDNGYTVTEARVYEGLASIYDGMGIWDNTLKYLLMAAAKYKDSADSLPSAIIHNRIARRYLLFEVPTLAASHFIKEYRVYNGDNPDRKASAAYAAAESFQNGLDTINALLWYDSARVWFSTSGNQSAIFSLNNRVIPLLAGSGLSSYALELATANLNAVSPESDRSELIQLNNNIGFLHFRTGDYQSAMNRFKRAEEYCLLDPADETRLVDVYSNLAICYQNTGNIDMMFRYFREARKIAEDKSLFNEKGAIELLIATVYYSDNDLYNSELYCNDCISSSMVSGNTGTLSDCYALYADVLEAGNDFIKALEFYQKHLNLRDSIAFEARNRADRQAERNLYYETIEQQLKLDIADEELRDLTLRNLRAEAEKQEKELELLYSEQERARIESENLKQSLALIREREEADRRQQEIQSLEQQRRIQELELEARVISERELQNKNQLLENEALVKERELQQEKEARKLTLYIAILMVLVVISALYGLVSTRRKNQKLAESKRRIEEINSALEVKNVEISNQKEIIEQKNQSITDSILYAARIQNAVLLPLTFLTDWGIENFIYFRPKDIVSGDFYWGFRRKGRIYVASVDCTGHGVPGGFMSMLGHAFLNEILITTELTTASEILDKLRDEIIRALRQKGLTGEARDGMDISMAIIDRKSGTLQYAGANNPIYVVSNGELTRYQADRMPIGIHVTDISPFTNHTIKVSKGDAIYLFSDGFADQFGGDAGKKFMYKPFQELLNSIASKPMADQMVILNESFEEWKKGYEQVDDVLVIGIRIK